MKIVVAYSGGLDTSVILKWLKETYRCEIIAFCADIGQEEELQGLDKKAKATGASKYYALDLVEFQRATGWRVDLAGRIVTLRTNQRLEGCQFQKSNDTGLHSDFTPSMMN